MQLPSHRADALCEEFFNVHVNIFGSRIKLHLARFDLGEDLFEALANHLGLILRDDPALAEHCGMGNTTLYILTIETAIKMDGRMEIIHSSICLLLKPSTPELHLNSPYPPWPPPTGVGLKA